jgi:hypothetical protein
MIYIKFLKVDLNLDPFNPDLTSATLLVKFGYTRDKKSLRECNKFYEKYAPGNVTYKVIDGGTVENERLLRFIFYPKSNYGYEWFVVDDEIRDFINNSASSIEDIERYIDSKLTIEDQTQILSESCPNNPIFS